MVLRFSGRFKVNQATCASVSSLNGGVSVIGDPFFYPIDDCCIRKLVETLLKVKCDVSGCKIIDLVEAMAYGCSTIAVRIENNDNILNFRVI
jgi:hypothetical protein